MPQADSCAGALTLCAGLHMSSESSRSAFPGGSFEGFLFLPGQSGIFSVIYTSLQSEYVFTKLPMELHRFEPERKTLQNA